MRYVVHNHFPARRTLDNEFASAYAQAQDIDPLHYLDGLSKLTFVGDPDKWNAGYMPEDDEIIIQAKFHNKDFLDKVQTLLHEAGHRGQMKVDKPTFAKFKKAGLINEDNFLAMANQVHQNDYRENGISKGELADEVFAESYARFALGLPMPDDIRRFWAERIG